MFPKEGKQEKNFVIRILRKKNLFLKEKKFVNLFPFKQLSF